MKVPVTVHGFRSSFRDWAGEATHHPREIAEEALELIEVEYEALPVMATVEAALAPGAMNAAKPVASAIFAVAAIGAP